MTGFIILILIVAFAGAFFALSKNKNGVNDERVAESTPKPSNDVDDSQLLADANRLLAIAELLKQSQTHGDDETYQACLANKYNGVLPVQKADGTWTNLYKQSLTFSIAGINFRKGIREKLGDLDIQLVPEPDNTHDPNAIKVMSSDGTHLGYVPASMTDEVRTFTSSAFPYHGTATITEETDDDDDTRTFFVGEVTLIKEIQKLNN